MFVLAPRHGLPVRHAQGRGPSLPPPPSAAHSSAAAGQHRQHMSSPGKQSRVLGATHLRPQGQRRVGLRSTGAERAPQRRAPAAAAVIAAADSRPRALPSKWTAPRTSHLRQGSKAQITTNVRAVHAAAGPITAAGPSHRHRVCSLFRRTFTSDGRDTCVRSRRGRSGRLHGTGTATANTAGARGGCRGLRSGTRVRFRGRKMRRTPYTTSNMATVIGRRH
ncbi:hypothetical protein Zmor_009133 [Zophobas morio]|uniref:Uncharacterized protein n=1 Tax=Zophobas morio TaxID=2755281 RepID=A0AA38MI41_9CUCU|nr:hypothetical protein Zmor_009133 [Zophobas morio]